MQPHILIPFPPRAPAWTVLEPPAVPVSGSRFIVEMYLGESKRMTALSGLVFQCLCSILAINSHSTKISPTHPLLASGGLG